MIKTAIAFLLGCLLCLSLDEIPEPSWIFLLVLIVVIWLRQVIVTAFIVGLLWTAFQVQLQLHDRLPSDLAGKDVIVSGEVLTIPSQQGRRIRFEFAPNSPVLPSKVRLSWYHAPPTPPKAGETWQLQIRLKPPYGMSNPGGFDYEKWLFTHNIGATGYVRKSAFNQYQHAANAWNINRLRQQLQSRLKIVLKDAEHFPLVQGLAIGVRDALDSEHWNVLRQTGTSHLLAISGLHIGLACALGFFGFRFLWSLFPALLLRIPAQYIGAIGGLLMAAFYACLAGFTVPTQRAFIMVSTMMLALLVKRPLYPLHVLALSLLLVLVFDPFAAVSAGFWLSFSAVTLIIFTSTQRYPSRRWNWAGIHLWIAIGLTPLLILFFGQISLISPVANLFAVPLVSFLIVPFILAGMVLLFVSEDLAEGAFHIADILLEVMWRWLSFLSDSPISVFQTPTYSLPVIMLLLVSMLLLLLPRGWPAKWLGLILLLPLFYYQTEKPDAGHFYFSLLDVGQGLAAVVETENNVLVFDTGPRYSEEFDTGRAVIAPFLKNRGINKVDRLIVSHGDNDHIGGAKSLTELSTVDTIYTSDVTVLPKSKACIAGQSWEWDKVQFNILQPFPAQTGSNNNRSCVLKITGLKRSVLIPGDIEKESEMKLVKQYGKHLHADILVIPHHGSSTSSSMTFIKAVNPTHGLIPVGYRNRYNFPVEKVLNRHQEQGITLHRTDYHGAILFRETPQAIHWRQHNAHLWTSNATE
ncbi:DNA internalization-related competence protein ComEC/Rec2 [Methylophaga sp.]|uniref:DNA internalization-related competence protein ComEC/Rec2 n=1 Tax=Methylophaga sp. TaxID=2024840 RepID=UPI003F69911F